MRNASTGQRRGINKSAKKQMEMASMAPARGEWGWNRQLGKGSPVFDGTLSAETHVADGQGCVRGRRDSRVPRGYTLLCANASAGRREVAASLGQTFAACMPECFRGRVATCVAPGGCSYASIPDCSCLGVMETTTSLPAVQGESVCSPVTPRAGSSFVRISTEAGR
jgi:hypothetical protein